MLEPHRTMARPGEGIVRPNGAATQHSEYPKHMIHPGYQPGKVGAEVKSPHGFTYHVGGEAIRFPPVLAMDEDQEAYHASQGYVSIGKSDPAAFARAATAAAPQAETYVPDPYPKWIAAVGRSVATAEEEAEALGLTNEGAPRSLPAPTPAVTPLSEMSAAVGVDAAPQDARIAALEQKVDTIVTGFDKLSGMLAQVLAGQTSAAPEPYFRKPKADAEPKERSPESIARGEKIRAGIAAKKAAAEAARRAAGTETGEPEVEPEVGADDC